MKRKTKARGVAAPARKESATEAKAHVDPEIEHFTAAFRSIELVIGLANDLTGTKVRDKDRVQLIEIGNRRFTLEVPARSGAKGHTITLDIEVKGAPKGDWRFEATARIDDLEHLEDGIDRLEVSLVQFEEEAWRRLTSTYGDRQREIEEFLRAAQGY